MISGHIKGLSRSQIMIHMACVPATTSVFLFSSYWEKLDLLPLAAHDDKCRLAIGIFPRKYTRARCHNIGIKKTSYETGLLAGAYFKCI